MAAWDEKRAFACLDCGRDCHSEYYMVDDALWARAKIAPDGGMLCVGCLESRIGRQLTRADFVDAPINWLPAERSTRLFKRLWSSC